MKRVMRGTLALVLVAALLLVGCGQQQKLDDLMRLGERYLSEQDYAGAILAFEDALAIDPKLVDAWLGLATVYQAQGYTHKAAGALRRGWQATGDEALQGELAALEEETAAHGAEELEVRDEAYNADYEVQWADAAFGQVVSAALGKAGAPVMRSELDGIIGLSIFGDQFCFFNSEGHDRYSWRHIRGNGDGDMGTLTAFYGVDDVDYTTRGSIYSIADVEHFRNLNSIQVVANHISDLSPLAGCRYLVQVNFFANEIEDFSVLDMLGIELGGSNEQFVEIGDQFPMHTDG